jgi:transposase
MGRSKTPSFVTEMALLVSSTEECTLLSRLEAGRQVYNACLGESLRRLALLRQSKAYQAARRLPRGSKGSAKAKARGEAFDVLRECYGFSEFSLHAYVTQFSQCWIGEHLDAVSLQTLATRAYRATNDHFLGKRGRPRFKSYSQLDSIEAKSNEAGIRWRTDHVEWRGLNLKAVIPPDDQVIAHGLACPVKFARIVRRKHEGRNRFVVQLINRGQPYRKEKHKLGTGRVGLDKGPSTIAVVGSQAAFLEPFCPEVKEDQAALRRAQRRLDRQRRANNPTCYRPDGTAIKGVRPKNKSRRMQKTETRIADIKRRQAAHRTSQHGQLVNRILAMGDSFHFEKLSYRAFQRRYGKSVGRKAPAKFVALLRRKAVSAGGTVHEFPTRSTKLSQTCHCGSVVKKPLSQRWHRCSCGVEAQRDLYSAFLATCVEGDRLDADQARTCWSGVDTLLRAVSSRTIQPASGRPRPVSSARQRRSRSPVASRSNVAKVPDAVPIVPTMAMLGEPGKGLGTPRTPRVKPLGVRQQELYPSWYFLAPKSF